MTRPSKVYGINISYKESPRGRYKRPAVIVRVWRGNPRNPRWEIVVRFRLVDKVLEHHKTAIRVRNPRYLEPWIVELASEIVSKLDRVHVNGNNDKLYDIVSSITESYFV